MPPLTYHEPSDHPGAGPVTASPPAPEARRPTVRRIFADALRARTPAPDAHRIHWPDGTSDAVPIVRWIEDAGPDELALLAGVRGPVLDVGCGPGRHVAALQRRGIDAVGIDVLPEAIRAARRRGAHVLERSVFADVPRAGRWATVLLLDGNIGIGGDPVALLRRVRELLRHAGSVLVETEASGVGVQLLEGRLEAPDGRRSARFPWARVGTDGIGRLAAATGFALTATAPTGGRWFAELTATPA
jgi:SAM-dependent methyltransferase